MFEYSHATIESNLPGSFVFRVHGSAGFYDLLIQVKDEAELFKWSQQFKKRFYIIHDTMHVLMYFLSGF